MAKVTQFLDYAATHPDAIVTYHASNMVLAGHSNASYLSETNAHSRAGGSLFHVQQHHKATQQWRHSHYCTHYQSSHVIGGGGQSRHTLNHL